MLNLNLIIQTTWDKRGAGWMVEVEGRKVFAVNRHSSES